MKSPFTSLTNQFLIRTPCLPVSTILVEDHSTEATRLRLRELLDNPIVREALVIASQNLDKAIEDWRANPFTAKSRATERSLLRYLARMATRSTPFGLFSACVVGEFGEATALRLASHGQWRRRTRIDNDYLYEAMITLGKDRSIRQTLTYWPNDTSYIAAGKLRYAEARVTGGTRAYFLMSAALTDYLQAVITRAAQGATVAELVEVLRRDPDISQEEAEEFLHELIDAQVLTSKLMPNVTGREPTTVLIELLQTTSDAGAKAAAVLERARLQLERLDAAAMGTAADTYERVMATLGEEMPEPITKPTNISRTFQVDLFSTLEAPTVGTAVLDAVKAAAEFVCRIGTVSTDLNREFRESFSSKFEQQAVPLAMVLDSEVGARSESRGGSDTPVLAGIRLPPRGGAANHPQLTPKVRWLQGLYERALRQGSTTIEITEADVAAAPKSTSNAIPHLGSSCAMVSVAAADQAAIDAGAFQLRLIGIMGPTAANMLGRFCYGSPEIHQLTKTQLAAEEAQRPDAIFAEIVHLPQGRIGNILFRPVLRTYEIPYLGISGAASEFHIPVSDLMVSVEDGRVVLRSIKFGREVIPRLSTAHNYDHGGSFPLYRFLASLQYQYYSDGGWSWAALASNAFLPRVTYKNVVLSRATWHITAADLKEVEAATDGYKKVEGKDQAATATANAHAAIAKLRARLGWPRWVALAESDNELVVDLDNPAMTDMLAHELRGNQNAKIVEVLPAPEQTWVEGPGGTFAHEMMVPLFRARPETAAASAATAVTAASTAAPPTPPAAAAPARAPRPTCTDVARDQRLLSVGGECLYLKVYCGQTVANTMLREVMVPLIADPSFRGEFNDWFYLRYSDPDNHVRLRFFGEPRRLMTQVLPRLTAALQPLLANGSLDKIMLDTYQREVERYGGLVGVMLAEQLFSRDSDLALAFLEHTDEDAGPEALWPMALVAVDRLLEDFGYEPQAKLDMLTMIDNGFLSEFGMTPAYQKQLGDKFKAHRTEIAQAFTDPAAFPEHIAPPIYHALARRSERNREVVAALRHAEAAGQLTFPVHNMLDSVIHVNLNRIFTHSPRAQEMVLYDLLRRHYDGLLARQRKAAAQAT